MLVKRSGKKGRLEIMSELNNLFGTERYPNIYQCCIKRKIVAVIPSWPAKLFEANVTIYLHYLSSLYIDKHE